MYLTGYASNAPLFPYLANVPVRQHNLVPEASLVKDVTHVAIAFMQSSKFNQEIPTSWPLFTTVQNVRSKFAPGTSIMVAIGGWGDTAGFSEAARTEGNRKLFSRNVKSMVDATGADGSSLLPSRSGNTSLILYRC